jgi:hypothetical protein
MVTALTAATLAAGLVTGCGPEATSVVGTTSAPAVPTVDPTSTSSVGVTSSAPPAADGSTTATPTATGPTLAPSVFEGEAVTIDGTPFDLGELANKDLVLWFWAPW